MQKINNFSSLILALEKADLKDLKLVAEILDSIFLDVEEIERKAVWQDSKYTRNVVFRDEKFELLLLCWKKGQGSPIHDHSGSSCWMKLLKGEVKEDIYSYKLDKDGKFADVEILQSHTLKGAGFVYINDEQGVHKVSNVGEGNMITLHLYAKPIGTCLRYLPKENDTVQAIFEKDFQYEI